MKLQFYSFFRKIEFFSDFTISKVEDEGDFFSES